MPTGFSSFTTATQVAIPAYITYVPSGGTMVMTNRGKLIINKTTKQWALYDLESTSPNAVLFSGSLTQVTLSSTRIGLTGMAPASGHQSFILEIPYLGAQAG